MFRVWLLANVTVGAGRVITHGSAPFCIAENCPWRGTRFNVCEIRSPSSLFLCDGSLENAFACPFEQSFEPSLGAPDMSMRRLATVYQLPELREPAFMRQPYG